MVNSTPSRSVSNVSQNDTPETSTGSSYDDAYKFVINFRISNFTSLDDTVKSVPYYIDHTYWLVFIYFFFVFIKTKFIYYFNLFF